MKFTAALLLLPLGLGVSSCAGPGSAGYGGGYGNGYGGFNSYSTLPGNYNGSAYYHNGRYYTGGNYQTGAYSHQGRTYSSRYAHNGQHYYGGSHQHYSPHQGDSQNVSSMQQHSDSQLLQRRR